VVVEVIVVVAGVVAIVVAVVVVVDLEQPTRNTPAINIIISDANRSFFMSISPFLFLNTYP
jgi:hypothetical protein